MGANDDDAGCPWLAADSRSWSASAVEQRAARPSASASATSSSAVALGGEVRRNPRGQRVGSSRSAGPAAARTTRCSGTSPGHARGAVEQRRRRSRRPTARWCWPRRPDGEVQVARFGPTCGACSCTPRSTRRSSALGRRATAPSDLAARPRRGRAARRDHAARAELDDAWRRWPQRFADARSGRPDDEPPTSRRGCVRLGFDDARPRLGRHGPLGDARGRRPRPLVALQRPDRRRRPRALAGLVGLARRQVEDRGPVLLAALVDDEGTAMRLLLGARRQRGALADHLVRHPEHWRELTDPTLGSTRPAAYAVRAGLLRAVGADPDDPAADRRPCPTPRRSTRCGWSTAGSCCGWPPATWPTTSGSTTPPPSSPTSPPAPSTPRWRSPGRGSGETRRQLPAGRGRDGQVRRPRAQLRLRRRRDLRRRAGRRAPTRRRPCGPPPSWPPT